MSLLPGQGGDAVCVLGQAGRGRDRADGGAHLGRGQQDHHGQARAEHQHPQEPLHRAADNHPGPWL